MKGKVSKNKFLKVVLPALLVVAIICQAVGFQAVLAKGNVATTSSDSISNLTDQQLQALTNPILQSYKADSSHKVWKMTNDSRLAVLANQTNIENARLQEVVKLVNSEFVEKEIISSPLAMVYAQEKDVSYGDILIDIDQTSSITSSSNSKEAYKITIGENGVRLTGASENAIMHGLRTIQNLIITNDGLVYGEIVDYPNVAERRVHVDCARKYISKDWFIRQIREMSYMKMNALQIHFSENMGFRIECETDPSIVSDQYLTKTEVREILAEAKKYGINVIPSFDSPGHVDQILKAHPEYGQVNTSGNHYKSGLDVTNPEAIKYIRSLYDEYMDLFEGCTDFHIGGDEYMEFDRAPFTTQYKSVLNSYAVKKYGQGYIWKDVIAGYINDLAEYVHNRGFTPRIWNDGVYYGENSYYEGAQKIKMHDYIGIDFWSQMSWNASIANLQTFINKGHDTIYNINASFFYYVLRNSKPTDGREQHSFDNLNADRKIYNEWSPGQFQGNPAVNDGSDFIKGASLAIWCDNPNLCSEDVITEDIADELRALASKSWNTSSNSITDFDSFQENYTKLGNVAGFEKGSTLPDVGEFLTAGDLGKITIRFVDENNQELKHEVTKYGTVGEKFEFSADPIYGYRVIDNKPITGTYTKEGAVYVFTYELYTDKAALNNEVTNALKEKDYINETFSEYKTALIAAKAINDKTNATQAEVDEVYDELIEAKAKAVKIEYYALYVQSTYPLKKDDYVGGYEAYKQAVDAGKALLSSDTLNAETAKGAYEAIKTAKSNLVKPDGNIPTITATDNYYEENYGSPTKYSYEKMLDNDLNTKCWFGQEQAADKEFKFTFPTAVNMTSVQVIQPSNVGPDALKGADIEVSLDGEKWTKVGSITENDLDYTATFEKTAVKYVRVRLTVAKPGYWYQVSEVKFAYEQPQEDNTLRDMINEAEELDISGKSSVLVSNMVDALIAGQKEYVKGTTDTTTVETNLRNAIDALKNAADTTDLSRLIEEVQKLNEADYTVDSWNDLKTSYNKALKVLENKTATQEQVDKAYDDLDKAIKGLIDAPIAADKTELLKIMETTKELVEKDYTPESWKVLKDALDEANKVVADDKVTQEQVDKAYDDLDKAIKGLIDAPVIVDKKELSNVTETTNDFVEKDYTVDSWKAFKEALDHAKDVLQNENTTQDEVDQALASLQDAIKNLKTVSQTGNNDQPNLKPNDQIQTSIKKEDDNKTSSTKNNSHIKTGDDMSVVPYILLMATAGGYIALQRRNKED